MLRKVPSFKFTQANANLFGGNPHELGSRLRAESMSELLGSSGFFLCSVGSATLEILKAYIENQGRA
jgi:hypothetical protein